MHDRIVDLSYAAAHKLGIIGGGSGEVEVESLKPDAVSSNAIVRDEPVQSTPLAMPVTAAPVAIAAPKPAAKVTHENTYLQLGAFKTETSAKRFMAKMHSKLGHSAQTLSLHHQGGMVRVRIGVYSSAEEARNAAEKLHEKLGVKAFVSAP